MPSDRTKQILRITGNVLSIGAIVFIIERLFHYHEQLEPALAARLTLPVLLLSIVYAVSCVFTALAWRNALGHVNCPIKVRDAVRVYGLSQIAKYLPGNIFHIAGRQAMGMSLGMPSWPLAKSLAWEIGLLAMAALLFAGVLPAILVPELNHWLTVGVYTVLLVIAGALLWVYGSRWLVRGVLWNALFLLVCGSIFAALLLIISPQQTSTFSVVVYAIPVYIMAWLAGFLTPGAPAGVGIRELVAFTLLRGWLDEPSILAAIVAARLVSMLGDFMFFGLCLTFLGRPNKPAREPQGDLENNKTP